MSSRGSLARTDAHANTLRCLLVWLLATVATAGAAVFTAPTVISLTTGLGRGAAFEELLVQVCATAFLASSGWLWLVTTVTVLDLVGGRRPRGGTARRWVLLACGAALVAGSATPAVAHGGRGPSENRPAETDHRVIAGLVLPDRAVARPRPVTDDEHVVLPGDSLWSIAASRPSGEPVEARWRAIWAANRAVIGDDPDLILPGQRLLLPPTDHDRTTP